MSRFVSVCLWLPCRRRSVCFWLVGFALALSGTSWANDSNAPGHWAYIKPARPPLPALKHRRWPRNEIDFFILARLEREKLAPAVQASRATLIRRVSLDLTGLPPTLKQVEAFENDKSTNAYERVVERLLNSPRYGERMARVWLDLARYADSNGYHVDRNRSIWPYRDWVIEAFNRNLPFDQFTIEQLAGDLLSNATVDQKVATGFHRNSMFNQECGVDAEEFRVSAVIDRVNTTASVWLGTTLGCSQCHNHKYDPFTQREYYQFYAFFNNTPDPGGGNGSTLVPQFYLPAPEERTRMNEFREEMARLEATIKSVSPPDPVAKILAVPSHKRDDTEKKALADHEQSLPVEVQEAKKRLGEVRKAEAEFLKKVPATLVMEELATPRPTRVHIRGNFLDEGEIVSSGVPAALNIARQSQPTNRLELARWLVSPDNPLTARVFVNRVWELCFGAGLVKTGEDFGTQGEPPSHPELLDWLATEFVRLGWDIKALQKLIVRSATYRQSSLADAQKRERDPINRLLSRGPRIRLEAELIRDNALAISGLLSRKIGGPSVYPYQPPKLWGEFNPYNGEWTVSQGADRYRRGLYTFWRRSNPYPTFVSFDAPTRQQCAAFRPRTTTPLQALATLNDPCFFEAARALGQRLLQEAGPTVAAKVTHGFRLCTARGPTLPERDRLTALYHQAYAEFELNEKAAETVAQFGLDQLPSNTDPTELAAWTMVANALLNLDETITKE